MLPRVDLGTEMNTFQGIHLSPLHSAECRGSCLPDGTIWKFSDSLQLVQNALCWQELHGVEGAILGTAAASGNKRKVSPHATLPPLQ